MTKIPEYDPKKHSKDYNDTIHVKKVKHPNTITTPNGLTIKNWNKQ